MTEADKMFEKLGYEKHENNYSIYYTTEYNSIRFDKKNHNMCITGLFEIKVFQVINEKCKELGWLDQDYELDYWDEKSREEKLNND